MQRSSQRLSPEEQAYADALATSELHSGVARVGSAIMLEALKLVMEQVDKLPRADRGVIYSVISTKVAGDLLAQTSFIACSGREYSGLARLIDVVLQSATRSLDELMAAGQGSGPGPGAQGGSDVAKV